MVTRLVGDERTRLEEPLRRRRGLDLNHCRHGLPARASPPGCLRTSRSARAVRAARCLCVAHARSNAGRRAVAVCQRTCACCGWGGWYWYPPGAWGYPGVAAAPPPQLPQHICRTSGFVQWPFAAACGQFASAPNRASIWAVDASSHVPIWAANMRACFCFAGTSDSKLRSSGQPSEAYRAPPRRMKAARLPATPSSDPLRNTSFPGPSLNSGKLLNERSERRLACAGASHGCGGSAKPHCVV